MNVLYILGNGFDKAQKMKTGYPEFYQYLLENTDDDSPLLQQMKEEIKKDIDEGKNLWSDMEWAFGNFTEKIEKASELEDLHYEVSHHLQTYLKEQNKSFTPNSNQMNNFINDFLNPGKYIHATDDDRYKKYVGSISGGMYINVMSLNYTDTLEKLLGLKPTETKRIYNGSTQLMNICHVHGRLDGTIIFGVDNVEQIKNTAFRTEDVIKYFMVKEDSNLAMKNTRHTICENFIKDANLIILFGVSIGETDIRWWKLIGNEMKKRKNVSIVDFVFCPNEVPSDRLYRMAIVENKCKKNLLRKMGVTEDGISDRLFFVINSSIFSI